MQYVMEIPDHFVEGLARGTLNRTGSVIRETATGRISGFLREAGPDPISAQNLNAMCGVPSALNLAGNLAAVVNVGATVYYGEKILEKLDEIGEQVEEIRDDVKEIKDSVRRIEAQLRLLAYAVNCGFQGVAARVTGIEQFLERKLLANLRTAIETEQAAEHDRGGLNTAVELAFKVVDEMLEHMRADAEETRARMFEREGRDRLLLDDKDFNTLLRIRALSIALAPCLRMGLKTNKARFKQAVRKVEDLAEIHASVASAFLALRGENDMVYDDLLNIKFAGAGLHAKRVESIARKWDDSVDSMTDIVSAIQQSGGRAVQVHEATDEALYVIDKHGLMRLVKLTARERSDPSDPFAILSVLSSIYSSYAISLRKKNSEFIVFERAGASRVFRGNATNLADPDVFEDDVVERVVHFVDLLEASADDLERLRGHILAFEYFSQQGLLPEQLEETMALPADLKIPVGCALATVIPDAD